MAIPNFRHEAGTRGTQGSWPVLAVLLVAVVVSCGCVLWFMAAAMRNESLAVRQQLTEAYHRHMLDARKSMADHLAQRLARLRVAHDQPAPQAFAEIATSGAAHGAVVRSEAGQVLYPAPDAGPRSAAASAQADPLEQEARLETTDPAASANANSTWSRAGFAAADERWR